MTIIVLAVIPLVVFMLGWIGFLVAEKGFAQPPLWDVGHENLPLTQGIFRFLFNIGWWVSIILILRGLLEDLGRIPYIGFVIVIWGFIRILCTYVTVLGAPADLPPPPPLTDLQSFWDEIVYGLSSRNILFFSGHTGLPILGALLFSQHNIVIRLVSLVFPSLADEVIKILRPEAKRKEIIISFFSLKIPLTTILWLWAFVMGFAVIVTREHYTVDVVAALFMSAGIWLVIGAFIWQWLFKWVDRAAELMRRDYKQEFNGTEEK